MSAIDTLAKKIASIDGTGGSGGGGDSNTGLTLSIVDTLPVTGTSNTLYFVREKTVAVWDNGEYLSITNNYGDTNEIILEIKGD